MKKVTAVGILITMLLGLAAWAGARIVDNGGRIIRLETKVELYHNDIKEIKSDVKKLLRGI